MNLNDQIVVLTGITGGIAAASAKRLLESGAVLHVTARSQSKLDEALKELKGEVHGHILDLTDETSISSTFKNIGSFDHLVTPASSGMLGPLNQLEIDKARELIETKQIGQMLCVFHALNHISKKGSITLFSGTVSQKPMLGATMYAAVGAATEAACRIWGLELAPIRFNTIVPGVIKTDIWKNILGDDAALNTLEDIGRSLPVGRVGTPDEIAKAVEFLIGNEFITGTSLVVDGGHRLI